MRFLQLLSVLLLCAVWAAAQDSSQTSSTQAQTPSSTQTKSDGGGDMTVQGCLSGSSGNYTLTDKNGMTYQLTGDSAKLSEHVGHEIQVTGTTSSATASPSGGTSGSDMGKANSSQQSLQVSSVKHISKTCSK